MPRGENKGFRKRVGVLSEPLIKKNLRNMIKKRTSIEPDKMDLEALVDEELTFGENLENVERYLEKDLDSEPRENPDVLQGELEKYREEWKNYKERNGIEIGN